jgi:hypothetical protein
MQNAKCKILNGAAAFGICHFAFCILQFLRRARPTVAALLLGVATGLSAHADVLELTNGGRVEGRLVQAADGEKKSYVVELAGGGRVTIPRGQVAQVDSTSEAEAEYAELARTAPDTVESHWKLAEWCRDRKLRPLAQKHLTRILELDPNHGDARAILGFRKKDGEWKTREEVMAARGMVMYEGRYVTRQHVELLEKRKEAKETHADWANNLERLRRWLTGKRQDRSAQALAEIQSIGDPAAAPAVAAMLKREDDPDIKRLWMEAAARMDHRAAVDVLVQLSLLDPDAEIRHESLEYLIRSGRRGLVTPYVRALKDRDNEIINRAGAALGQIGDASAMGALIDALITKHQFKVAEGQQDTYTFSPQSGGMTFGGGGPKYITQPLRNPDVLAALVSLSGGVSFDYDQAQWRRWLAAQAKQQVVDVRRDE